MAPSFPIPASMQDLEREPYNLLPYPDDFADDDEAARAESFESLVDLLDCGNRALQTAGMSVFTDNVSSSRDKQQEAGGDNTNNGGKKEEQQEEEDEDCWNDEDHIQALYTLVRKSSSLAPATKARFIDSLCGAVQGLSGLLVGWSTSNRADIVPQSFRDAFACQIYMLFSVMFLTESEAKAYHTTHRGASSRSNNKDATEQESLRQRSACADAMLSAARAMCSSRSQLWPCGIPDEAVAILPCRIAYLMLETATGVVARKAVSADAALGMIAATVDSAENLLGTVVAALVDLLHSYEHIAPLTAELCCMVSETPTNRLAVELVREIGRLDAGMSSEAGMKASGIKNLAPFISELASARPRLVLANISHLLSHLNHEPYNIRSAIATAIGHILVHLGARDQQENQDGYTDGSIAAEEPSAAPINSNKSRDALLNVLTERVNDNSSYTRSTVLKTWTRIVQSGCLPLERLIIVTSLAIDRLQDKTVIVRRSAMQLVTSLLEHNPFLGSLEPTPYREKLTDMYADIKECMPEHIKEAETAAVAELEDPNDAEAVLRLQHATLATAIAEADGMTNSDSLSTEDHKFLSKIQGLKFAQSALEFIDKFEGANEEFNSMLLSANTSDVTEALRFFVRARHFKLPCAVTGMKQALALMWSTETSIRDEVLKAFVEVFIAVPGTEGKQCLPDRQVAQNLLELVGRSSVSETASIEEAVCKLVKQELIASGVFLKLWSVAAKSQGTPRACALHLLSMGAQADRSIVDSASRLKHLLAAGLGDEVEDTRDWMAIRSSACVLHNVKIPKDPASAKALVLEQIIERLCTVVRGDWCDDTTPTGTIEWFAAAEQAISALFVISRDPEVECGEIVRFMSISTFGKDQHGNEQDDETTDDYPRSSVGQKEKDSDSNDGDLNQCSDLRLSRFFFVLGHIALKLLVYTEGLGGAVRRANAIKTLRNQESAEKAQVQANSRGKQNNGKDNNDDDDDDDNEEDGIEAQLGMAAEQDAENEKLLADISEKEILGRGLISKFTPALIRVVANEGDAFCSTILRRTATLALCKFMCVSAAFCEENLPLLFHVLQTAPSDDTTLRANIVVALGDHAFRFPNEVEPYTPKIYACLRDPSTKVRRHTLMVLTHLILNDMVKVKGQVCEIALCLRDDDQRIRDMSRLLFHELSKRSHNPIYNLLPDIISQLSQMSVETDDFRYILSFLMCFIKRERQHETLVEKLCLRFPKCTSVSQQADLAFCIAQLRVNERAIKFLSDNFKLYKDALADDDVKKSFASVATKTKKSSTKPELRQSIEEWEGKLNEFARVGQENELARDKASKARAKAKRQVTKQRRRGQRSPTTSTNRVSDGDEKAHHQQQHNDSHTDDHDDDDDDDDDDDVSFGSEHQDDGDSEEHDKENEPMIQNVRDSKASSKRSNRRIVTLKQRPIVSDHDDDDGSEVSEDSDGSLESDSPVRMELTTEHSDDEEFEFE